MAEDAGKLTADHHGLQANEPAGKQPRRLRSGRTSLCFSNIPPPVSSTPLVYKLLQKRNPAEGFRLSPSGPKVPLASHGCWKKALEPRPMADPALSLPPAHYPSPVGSCFPWWDEPGAGPLIPKSSRKLWSQNHRMVGVGRDLCGSSSPTLLLKQGHLQ